MKRDPTTSYQTLGEGADDLRFGEQYAEIKCKSDDCGNPVKHEGEYCAECQVAKSEHEQEQ